MQAIIGRAQCYKSTVTKNMLQGQAVHTWEHSTDSNIGLYVAGQGDLGWKPTKSIGSRCSWRFRLVSPRFLRTSGRFRRARGEARVWKFDKMFGPCNDAQRRLTSYTEYIKAIADVNTIIIEKTSLRCSNHLQF